MPKADNILRLYIKYYNLNNIVVKNRYLFPYVFKILDCLVRVKVIPKINLINIYYQIYIIKGDK